VEVGVGRAGHRARETRWAGKTGRAGGGGGGDVRANGGGGSVDRIGRLACV